MSWVVVGVAAAGAIKGMMDAKNNRERAADHDQFRQATIQHSPWTGMGDPGAAPVGNTGTLSGALGGGLQGAMVGSMFSGMGAGGQQAAQAPLQAQSSAPVAMNTRGMAKSPWMTA